MEEYEQVIATDIILVDAVSGVNIGKQGDFINITIASN